MIDGFAQRRRFLPFRKKRFTVRSYFGLLQGDISALVTGWRGLETHGDSNNCIQHHAVSKNDVVSRVPRLSFNRLQLKDEECNGLFKRNFGRFVAQEAILDEEYWTAAWPCAEARWESASCTRHVDKHKSNHAEQEFYALKRRCLIKEEEEEEEDALDRMEIT